MATLTKMPHNLMYKTNQQHHSAKPTWAKIGQIRTLTIKTKRDKAWLADKADKAGVNFSKIFQKAPELSL